MAGRMVLIPWTILMLFMNECVNGQDHTMENQTEVTSPNFPESYPPNTDRQWNFSMDHGQWTVIFRTVSLERSPGCEKDYLYIYDGITSTYPAKRLCDKIKNMADFKSTQPSIRVVFHSDDTVQSEGFQMDVVHIPNEDYYKQLLERRRAQAAKVTIQVETERSVLFQPLTISLVVLSVILLALAIYLIVNMRRKKTQSRGDTILDIKPHRVPTMPAFTSGRRYTRQLSVDSDNSPHMGASNKPEVHSPTQMDAPGYNSYT